MLSFDLAPPLSPNPHSHQQVVSLSQSSCVSPVEHIEGRGGIGGVRGAKSPNLMTARESLVLYKSFNTLCILPSPHYLVGMSYVGGGGGKREDWCGEVLPKKLKLRNWNNFPVQPLFRGISRDENILSVFRGMVKNHFRKHPSSVQ